MSHMQFKQQIISYQDSMKILTAIVWQPYSFKNDSESKSCSKNKPNYFNCLLPTCLCVRPVCRLSLLSCSTCLVACSSCSAPCCPRFSSELLCSLSPCSRWFSPSDSILRWGTGTPARSGGAEGRPGEVAQFACCQSPTRKSDSCRTRLLLMLRNIWGPSRDQCLHWGGSP